MELRKYQVETINQVKNAILAGHKRIIVHLATGGGKGLIMAQIAQNALQKGNRVLTIMRMKSIVHQTNANYKKYFGIESSVIMANRAEFSDSSICSIDTLISRFERLPEVAKYPVVICDECHLSGSDSYQGVLSFIADKNPRALFIGLSATPYRTGNRGLDWWETSVRPITDMQLIEQGYLCPYKVFSHFQIDTKGIKKTAGDFDNKELERRASESKVIGNVLSTYKEHHKDSPALLFAVNKAHSRLMASEFEKAGIPAAHADADTPQEEREALILRHKNGDLRVICNVNIFSTGVDMPWLKTLLLARPTHSLILHRQQVGRVLRTFPGKEIALIEDFAGNAIRHGMLEREIPAELTSLEKGTRSKALPRQFRTCPSCFYLCPPTAEECPECGENFEPEVPEETESVRRETTGESKAVLSKAMSIYYLTVRNYQAMPIKRRRHLALTRVKTSCGQEGIDALFAHWKKHKL